MTWRDFWEVVGGVAVFVVIFITTLLFIDHLT